MTRSRRHLACRLPSLVGALVLSATGFSEKTALAVFDYSSSLAADFTATYPGGDPTAGPPVGNPFGANTEWELHGPGGTAAELAPHGGLPASGQSGWCQGDATSCNGDPLHTYFAAQFQPGVTLDPRIAGHGPQEVLWTAPANIDEGGVAISGAIEQMFESSRRMRLSVFKNASANAAFFADALPPIVNGVILQRADFGPFNVSVNAGDTLRFVMDGSGAGGNGIATFVAWDVQLTESTGIPEPASGCMLLVGMLFVVWNRRRRS